jgi:hypothetical protein
MSEDEINEMFRQAYDIYLNTLTFHGEQFMVDALNEWIDLIQKNVVSGVEQVTVTPSTAPKGVYSISGQLVKSQSDNLNDLPKGIYIVNGKKVVK